MHERLSHFLEKNKILNRNQFGFRPNSSTENAVLKICDEISYAFNNKDTACTVFVDLRKAFDTINHQILLDKLHNCGVRGIAHNIFKSYLNNRRQYTIINCTPSSPKIISCGVPQGSVIGPLLFFFINETGKLPKKKETSSYVHSQGSERDLRNVKIKKRKNKKANNKVRMHKNTIYVTTNTITNVGKITHDTCLCIFRLSSVRLILF